MQRLACSFAFLFVVAVATATLSAGEPTYTVNLLARDSLAGWDHGPEAPHGWQVRDGKLSGTEKSSPLLAAWSFGDGELTITFPEADDHGVWRLSLLAADDGKPQSTVSISRTILGFEVGRGDYVVAESQGEANVVKLRRAGSRVELLHGKASEQFDLPRDVRITPQVSIASGQGTIESITWTAAAGEPIFNGQNLDGWWTPGNLSSWKAEGGRLVCLNNGGNYLRTEQSYGNFVLTLQYKIAAGGNSGFGIRTPRDGWPSGDGIEMQILDEPGSKQRTRHSTMGMYGNLEPLARADKPAGEWNEAVIRAEGHMISGWINGQLVQQTNTARLPELKHRHLQGWIGFQDHNSPVEFRDIRVEQLPAGEGLATWYGHRRETGAQLVLDRLMNPVRLAQGDEISAGLATARAAKEETVLAELEGPGAVVQISRTGSTQGTLAFYFDGAEQPALECQAKDLFDHVPLVDEYHREPLLTYLPYEKSLRVVLRDAGKAEYRFEYVTLPHGLPKESFDGPEGTVARGLLPALSYRAFMGGTGKFRDNDPQPRETASPRTIEPGSSVPLVNLAGAGHVQWWKLEANRKVLANDDLWLEVTIDGEQKPAIAAPVRYLLPGLQLSNVGKERYRNFVLFDKEGYRTLLPMPYTNGLRITAVNRGSKPIQGVGLTVSYVPAAAVKDNSASPLRLRGEFLSSGTGDELLHLDGGGRLIGLVCETGDGPMPEIASVQIDGADAGERLPGRLSDFFLLPEKGDDSRGALSGKLNGLAWRYLLLTPVDYEKSLSVKLRDAQPGNRLVLYYQ